MEYMNRSQDPSTEGKEKGKSALRGGDCPFRGESSVNLSSIPGIPAPGCRLPCTGGIETSDSLKQAVVTHTTYRKRKRGGRCGPDARIAPGEPSAVTLAIQRAASDGRKHMFYPDVGTTFNSCEEAREFYNLFSWEVGFGIRNGKSSTNKHSYRSWQDFVCTCEGFDKDPNSESCRTGCRAKIRLHRTEDHGWYISTLNQEHNHPLSESYHEKKQWRSHSEIDPTTKTFIRNLRENNINLGRVCNILNCSPGISSLPAFKKGAVKSLCGQLAQDKLRDDIGKTVALLEEIRQSDPNFSVCLDVDENGTIMNIMWCTGKNKIDYAHFGDAVTFDTTYRTNLYKMPFGLFVGVNNHFQSVIFVGVLMAHETTEAFQWVSETFARLMGNVEPKTILTDQATAMQAALRKTWKNSTHRWCRWHVLRNAKSKIGPKYSKYSGFKAKFNFLVSAVMTAERFEESWAELITAYKLKKNKFLQRIYKHRKMWAKPYFLNVFCAGMTSTQRSESANHMLKGHIPRESPMHLFVRKYNCFLQNRDADAGRHVHATKQKRRSIRIGVPIELHAKNMYTKAMFQRFGDELFEAGSFAISRYEPPGNYAVRHATNDGFEFSVTINDDHSRIDCSCGRITHVGMPCRHSLKVLIHLDKTEIPKCNILERWTPMADKTAELHGTNNEPMEQHPHSEAFMHTALWVAAKRFVDNGTTSRAVFGAAISMLNKGADELQQIGSVSKIGGTGDSSDSNGILPPDFMEVFNRNRKQSPGSVKIKCPPRWKAAGATISSHLSSWKDQKKREAREKKESRVSVERDNIDDATQTVKLKRLADVGINSVVV